MANEELISSLLAQKSETKTLNQYPKRKGIALKTTKAAESNNSISSNTKEEEEIARLTKRFNKFIQDERNLKNRKFNKKSYPSDGGSRLKDILTQSTVSQKLMLHKRKQFDTDLHLTISQYEISRNAQHVVILIQKVDATKSK